MKKNQKTTQPPKQPVKPCNNGFNQTLDDLQQIYQLAFDKGDLAVAIKAKELISKICGFLDHKKTDKPFDIKKISESELEEIVSQLRSELEN